ncbi:MAG TPA: cysteine desulfurase family protein [Candidatus Cybelea sp.]|nr:cysteine desulfurase family protein [Candidatus Cybelea sp.]
MPIYLDYNATTPVDRRVLDAMLPYLGETFGNASSIHSAGQHARAAVDAARESVALLIGARPAEIVFTSGGTEADNLALLGAIQGSSKPRKHVITTSIEHHAVLNTCQALEQRGIEITYVGVGDDGIVDPGDVRRALKPETVLISVMHANNETGAIQPVEAIGQIAADAGVYFHSDAVQSAGKLPIDVDHLHADLLSLSAHKIYGPKGVGALYVRSGTPVEPQLFGGHHQRDLRPGTENVPGIVGLGKAAELARLDRDEDCARIAVLRDRLEDSLLSAIGSVRVNGDRQRRVSNTTNLAFAGAGGEALLIALDLQGLACSTGAACSSGAVEPSHVLTAMGLSSEEARSSLRFSLGRDTTGEEIDEAMAKIPRAVARIRALSPASKTPVLAR